MAYEIPQNLKYTEKIAFGLTFMQMLWLGLFGGIAALIFFKFPLDFPIRVYAALPFMCLGIGFAFMNLSTKLADINTYRNSIREAGYFDKKLGELIEVKKIENNAIYLKSGQVRAVFEVTPINFSILSKAEQEAIVYAYRGFLNSLDFPIQIVMRTTTLSIDNYLAGLKKQVMERNSKELAEQFASFEEFMRRFIEENSVKNRLFYIVVPYSPSARINPLQNLVALLKNRLSKTKTKTALEMNREIALNQLDVRVQLCREKLKRCGLLTRRLETGQLVSLLASFFESYIEADNDYLFPMTMLGKFEEKGDDANGQKNHGSAG